jgi:F-type H+-transporting ATPase subunit delta
MIPIGSFRISRYARAFVGAVLDVGGEEALAGKIEESRTFAKVWLESAALQKALDSSAVPASERRAVIAQLCTRLEIGEQTRNLLFILSDRYLLHDYPAIVDSIAVLREERLGIERVHITSSRELKTEERENLKTQIESYRKSKIELTYTIDQSVLGGVRMQIGSTVLDDTIKGRLDDLLKTLRKDDFYTPSRQETDLLERWDDDGGAPGATPPDNLLYFRTHLEVKET